MADIQQQPATLVGHHVTQVRKTDESPPRIKGRWLWSPFPILDFFCRNASRGLAAEQTLGARSQLGLGGEAENKNLVAVVPLHLLDFYSAATPLGA